MKPSLPFFCEFVLFAIQITDTTSVFYRASLLLFFLFSSRDEVPGFVFSPAFFTSYQWRAITLLCCSCSALRDWANLKRLWEHHCVFIRTLLCLILWNLMSGCVLWISDDVILIKYFVYYIIVCVWDTQFLSKSVKAGNLGNLKPCLFTVMNKTKSRHQIWTLFHANQLPQTFACWPEAMFMCRGAVWGGFISHRWEWREKVGWVIQLHGRCQTNLQTILS